MKPDINGIVIATRSKQPYFFSRNTLSFFGQTMRSFKVVESGSGRVFIYAPMRNEHGHILGYTFREYADGNLLAVRDGDNGSTYDSLDDIKRYLRTH